MSTIVFIAYILIKGELKPEKAYLVLFWFETITFPAKRCAFLMAYYLFGKISECRVNHFMDCGEILKVN